MLRHALALVTLLAVLCGSVAVRAADEWPSHPIRIFIPFTPGGTADTLGRIAGQKLQEQLGESVVMENKPGAGGLLAAELTAHAPSDGYNLIISGIGGFIIVGATTPNPPVDIVNDFTHIALLGGPPSVLIVRPDFPAHTLAEFIDYAKKNPGAISYGSAAAGSHSQLIAELFAQQAGISITHVPYRGASQAMTDILGSHLDAGSMTLTAAGAQIAAGKVRALAISTPKRVADFPDVPTYTELGYRDIVAYTWFALSGPANLPPEIVDRLNAAVVKGFANADVQERLRREAIYSEPFTSAQFTAFFKSEMMRWTPLAKTFAAKSE